MVAIASRARALPTLAAAGAALIAAALLPPAPGAPPNGCPLGVREHADDGMQLAARWQRHEAGAHVVVEIAAPAAAPVRPPRSVAIVIDRSKSMSGEPIEHAKAAAARLVSRLDAGDAFTVIAYSDSHTTVVPMASASATHKALALRAIAELEIDNGTCISCGLLSAAEWLERTPIEGGIRRMVLLSDGYANLGLRDRDDLVELAAGAAARGVSISAVGVGLDFDEQTMMRIAEVGRGNYYYVADAAGLDAALARELERLGETVATDVRLAVQAAPGVQIEEALGHAMAAAGGAVSIPIADLRAGETRKVVLRVSGAPPACGLVASLSWRRAQGGAGRSALAVARSDGGGAGLAAIEQALVGAVLERAAARDYERRGPAAARRVLEDYAAALDGRPGLDPIVRGELRAQLGEAAAAFGAAAGGGDGAGAVKLSRSLAHALAR
ncbi:MAG TPA: VWA domain-containing protein [Kofleriaceae bacterium]|nr:VWA domain-containing protein [Kofleriaceae bacterium]